MARSGRTAFILASALMAIPGIAAAQEPVRSFDQLDVRLKPGDTVWVTDAQGREVKGKIQMLAPDTITLRGGAGTFAAGDVRTIQEREADSLKNGGFIGMGVGGGLALTTCLTATSEYEDDEAGWCAVAALVYAGVGAGIGVGIDALIPGKKLVVYRAPGAPGKGPARVSIAPLVTPHAKGAAISFAF